MAAEKKDEAGKIPKPVRKVKKPVPEPAPEPREEAPKAAPEAVPKSPAKTAAPVKTPARKPVPKKALEEPKGPTKEETKPEPGKPAAEEKAVEKKPPAAEKVARKAKKPARKEEKPAKKEAKKKGEAEEEEEEHEARKKPELADAARAALRMRSQLASRRPTFYRQEWYRYRRLGLTWRKPQGGQSKLRRHLGYRINVVSIGFRGPKAVRGLHPSGFQEVLVHTVGELKGVDPKTQAVRIAGTVGTRKRAMIQEEAEELGLRVLNRREA